MSSTRLIAAGLMCVVSSLASAADLTAFAPFCVDYKQSDILLLSQPELGAVLLEHRDMAREARNTEVVIYSKLQTFNWAHATELQCNMALGYLKGHAVDEVSVQKCDCFYDRMMSLK